MTAVNVFAGLAFFNQLTVPLLILPVTVLMVVQAVVRRIAYFIKNTLRYSTFDIALPGDKSDNNTFQVSTRRIRDFLELPEANNVTAEDNNDDQRKPDKFNDAFVENSPDEETSFWEKEDENVISDGEKDDQFSDDETSNSNPKSEYLVRFRNAVFTWGMKNDTLLEVDDLDIPAGKFCAELYLLTDY